jgi:endonuclease-8
MGPVPEGDTIHRTAARLRPALEGQPLLRFEAPRLAGARPRVGETVESVEAVGKHLLVRFSGGLTLETHMRMTGSWHLYRSGGPDGPGERWREPAHRVRCRIDVPGWTAVCFSAPVVRTYPTAVRGTVADPIGHLGPDLARPIDDGAVAECVRRMDASDPDRAIGDVLLDQRVANGVGNVYRSEVCWACRVSPFRPVAEVPGALRAELVRTAARLLSANLTTTSRSTVPGGLAVYGRRGRPCRRCGTAVRSDHRSEHARVVYWCPTCQPT